MLRTQYQACFHRLSTGMQEGSWQLPDSLAPYFSQTTLADWERDCYLLQSFLAEPYDLTSKEHLVESWVDLSFDTKRLAPLLFVNSVLVSLETQIAMHYATHLSDY